MTAIEKIRKSIELLEESCHEDMRNRSPKELTEKELIFLIRKERPDLPRDLTDEKLVELLREERMISKN